MLKITVKGTIPDEAKLLTGTELLRAIQDPIITIQGVKKTKIAETLSEETLAEIKQWCINHKRRGLSTAAQRGYPFLERAFDQAVSDLTDKLYMNGFVVLEQVTMVTEHSSPTEEDFTDHDVLTKVVQELSFPGLPLSVVLDPMIKRVRIGVSRRTTGAEITVSFGPGYSKRIAIGHL